MTLLAPRSVRGGIVVAIDGSPSSLAALARAAQLATVLELRLELVHVWQRWTAGVGSWSMPPTPATATTATAAESILTAAVAEVLGTWKPSEIVQKVLEGETVMTLLRESEGSEFLVLGSRGRGTFDGTLFGSVSAACAVQATCAVLICHLDSSSTVAEPDDGRRRSPARTNSRAALEPEDEDLDSTHTCRSSDVVVGIDGSDAAIGALRQGVRFATSLHRPLHAITAWSPGAFPAEEQQAQTIVEQAVQQVFGTTSPTWLRTSARRGTPEAVLGAASEHARMLIIGHSEPDLGLAPERRTDVSAAIASRARCPIVIFHLVHAADPETALHAHA